MSVRRSTISIGSAVVALALATTACTSSGGSSSRSAPPAGSSSSSSMSMAPSTSSSSSSGSTSATDASATAAATLRTGLDSLFREHVNLTGFAVQTAVTSGLTSADTAMALKALDDNTVALGSAIGSLYGTAAKTAFIKMWRSHIGFFVGYTKGLATHDHALIAKSQKQLAGYKADFAKFLGQATGLPSSAVAADLQGHIITLEAAIRAIVSKSPTAASKLQMAAMHMDGTAAVLASGIAKQKNLAGSVTGPASTLRAGLTGLLIQHVAQTAAVVQTAVETSLTSAQTTAAVKALDDNTVALGSAIGSVYGSAAETAFIKMWRAHIGFFVNYTKGLATHDQSLVAESQKQLAGYKADFAKFLGQATGLPASAVAADLQGHITTLEGAIQAIVTKSPSAGSKVLMAESHMAGTAAVLAAAIAKQKHLS